MGIVSFGITIFIARQTGPVNFGDYSVALTVGAVLAIFIDGGMRNLLMRERTRSSSHLAHHLFYKPNSLGARHGLVLFWHSSGPVYFSNATRRGSFGAGCGLADGTAEL